MARLTKRNNVKTMLWLIAFVVVMLCLFTTPTTRKLSNWSEPTITNSIMNSVLGFYSFRIQAPSSCVVFLGACLPFLGLAIIALRFFVSISLPILLLLNFVLWQLSSFSLTSKSFGPTFVSSCTGFTPVGFTFWPSSVVVKFLKRLRFFTFRTLFHNVTSLLHYNMMRRDTQEVFS